MAASPLPPSAGLGELNTQVAETAVALKSLTAPAEEAAQSIDAAFSRAGESLARSLSRAAADGKISLSELASGLIKAFDQVSGSASQGGLGALLTAAISAFGGARADGGLVTPGQAYLVGERGPEIFRPAATGMIEAQTGGPQVVVNLNMGSDTAGVIRSESQLASAIARAARLGGR